MKTRVLESWTRLVLAVGIALAGFFVETRSARADGIVYGDTIPAGEVVDDDVVLSGTNVVIEGTVIGDVLAVGDTVRVSGTVRGSLVAVGETLSFDGEVDGSVYAAAVTLELGSQGLVSRSLYFGGLRLVTQPGSQIGRDLYARSLSARLAGQVGRDTKAVIGLFELIGALTDTAQVGARQSVMISSSTELPGSSATDSAGIVPVLALADSSVRQSASRTALASYAVGVPVIFSQPQAQVDPAAMETARQWLLARLREFMVLLLVGLLGVWLMPSSLARVAEKVRTAPLPASGYGFLALILAFNILGVLVLLAVLLLVIGLWLGFATVWELTYMLWAVGYSSLVLAASLFAVLVLYGSKVVMAYFAGMLLLNRLAPRAVKYRVLPLLLGLLLYVLLHSIPILGWVLGVVVTAVGLGAIWLAYREHEPDLSAVPLVGRSAS